jgi:hypothetical protein
MVKKRLEEATKKRLRAGRMLLTGKRPAKVAPMVGVAHQTVLMVSVPQRRPSRPQRSGGFGAMRC